jgi:hypothetical protein
MIRSILMLGVLGAVLVGAGILHVNWNKDTGSATVSIDKKKAEHAAAEVIDEAKVLEANLESGQQQTTK